jgi:hypothetical protein
VGLSCLSVSVARCPKLCKSREVGARPVRPVDPVKINALQSWPVPTNRSELRSFLGTFGYWRNYIKNYAAIVSCMTALTSDKIPLNWTPIHDKALLDLKTASRESPVLLAPRSDLPVVLVTDASVLECGDNSKHT